MIMGNAELVSLLMVVAVALTSFVLPTTLYYMISAVTLLFAIMLSLSNAKEKSKGWAWATLSALLAAVILVTRKTALFDCLIVLEAFFVPRLLASIIYRLSVQRKDKAVDNVEAVVPEESPAKEALNNTNDMVNPENRATDLVEIMIDLMASLEDKFTAFSSGQKQQMESSFQALDDTKRAVEYLHNELRVERSKLIAALKKPLARWWMGFRKV